MVILRNASSALRKKFFSVCIYVHRYCLINRGVSFSYVVLLPNCSGVSKFKALNLDLEYSLHFTTQM
jgi:hypothetical protein